MSHQRGATRSPSHTEVDAVVAVIIGNLITIPIVWAVASVAYAVASAIGAVSG